MVEAVLPFAVNTRFKMHEVGELESGKNKV